MINRHAPRNPTASPINSASFQAVPSILMEVTDWLPLFLSLWQKLSTVKSHFGSNWTKTHSIWPRCANTLTKSAAIKHSLKTPAPYVIHSIAKVFVS